MLPPRALSHLKPHFDEAHRTLLREKNPLGQWPNRVRVINRGLGGERPAIDADVLETVTEALLREYKCKLTYQARNWPEPEEIVVHPFGLIFRDPNVYLIGAIEGREGTRQMVLHRASAGELLEEAVDRPEGFDLDLYIRSGAMGILKSNEPLYLKLRCDKPALNHLIESPLGFDQITTEIDDETFEIGVTVGDTQDLRWWLTAQAIHCDILEPEWLRENITATLERGLARMKA
jgi:predicted DNA-binding transcriptional regulator YafY